ncbi:Retrotransposon [Abeliophyllum distichum]|uniref:Retrotransposon n=1 Tax=Abeliophyllum distichum TaxID=126358 RepID=A0ABD1SYR5_9LAMI
MDDMTLAQMFPHREHTSVQVVEFFDDTRWDIDKLLLVLPHCIAVQVKIYRFVLMFLINLCGKTPRMGLVPVDVIIQKRIRAHTASQCQCCSEIETIQHVVIDSPVAHQVWQYFSAIFGIPLKVGEMLQHKFQTWRFSVQFVKGGNIRTIISLLVLWFIWTARNDVKRRMIGMEPSHIIWRVHHTIFLLHTRKFFRFVHWRGDFDPHFGITLISPTPNSPIVYWRAPSVGYAKINTDGCVRDGFASGEGVIRDHTGRFIRPSLLATKIYLFWRQS